MVWGFDSPRSFVNNDDMEGRFLGGGGIGHVLVGGDIYLSADDLATLFFVIGSRWGLTALESSDMAGAGGAHTLIALAERVDTLRSELLKREVEDIFTSDLPMADFDLNPEFFWEEDSNG